MKISFVIPSRNRQTLLKNCIDSIFNTSDKPENIDVLVIGDNDDTSYDKFEPRNNVTLIQRERSVWWQRDYNNFGHSQTKGDLLWGLNDDCEIVTEKWDTILVNLVKDIYNQQKDKIAYIGMLDGTHREFSKHSHQSSCCFPILTRETFNVLECFMPEEIHMWGGDVALYEIFIRMKTNRVFFTSDIKVLHHSIHSKETPRDRDDITNSVSDISRYCTLNEAEYRKYVDRLNGGIIE